MQTEVPKKPGTRLEGGSFDPRPDRLDCPTLTYVCTHIHRPVHATQVRPVLRGGQGRVGHRDYATISSPSTTLWKTRVWDPSHLGLESGPSSLPGFLGEEDLGPRVKVETVGSGKDEPFLWETDSSVPRKPRQREDGPNLASRGAVREGCPSLGAPCLV